MPLKEMWGGVAGDSQPNRDTSDTTDDVRERSEKPPGRAEHAEWGERVDNERVEQRVGELRNEGHGPQRHCDLSDEKMKARLGQKDANGKIVDRLDPETGTTTDAVTGRAHHCGADATRVDDPADYVAAEETMRQKAEATIANEQAVKVAEPLERLYGSDYQDRVSGYRRDDNSPPGYAATDFTDGQMTALYQRTDGELKLLTMYPESRR